MQTLRQYNIRLILLHVRMDISKPSVAKIKTTRQQLINNKAPGKDNLLPEEDSRKGEEEICRKFRITKDYSRTLKNYQETKKPKWRCSENVTIIDKHGFNITSSKEPP